MGKRADRPEIMEVILMSDKKRPGMILYFELRSVFAHLSGENCRALLLAMMDYADNGLLPERLDPSLICVWDLIRARLDADDQRYQSRVQAARRAALIRWQGTDDADAYAPCQHNET